MEDGERAQIKVIAQEVGETLMERFEKTLSAAIERHQLTCDAVATVNKWRGQAKTLIIGIAIGAAVVGSGGTLGILKWFKII